MTGNNTREKLRAVLLAAAMVLSVVAMTTAFAGSAAAQNGSTIYVDGSSGGDGSYDNPYTSINTAIDNANSGDTVVLKNGSTTSTTYSQDVVIDQSITLTSENGTDAVTINGNAGIPVTVRTPDVTIEDVTIDESGSASGTAVSVGGNPASDVSGFTLQNSVLKGSGSGGPTAVKFPDAANTDTSNIVIENNEIDSFRTGIFADSVDGLTINNNTFGTTLTAGVGGVQGDATVTVTNNEFKDSGGAEHIGVGANGNLLVEDNVFRGTNGGPYAVQTYDADAQIDGLVESENVTEITSYVFGNNDLTAGNGQISFQSGATIVSEGATQSTDSVTNERTELNVSVIGSPAVNESSIDISVTNDDVGETTDIVRNGEVVNGSATSASTLDGSNDSVENINVSVALKESFSADYSIDVTAEDESGNTVQSGNLAGGAFSVDMSAEKFNVFVDESNPFTLNDDGTVGADEGADIEVVVADKFGQNLTADDSDVNISDSGNVVLGTQDNTASITGPLDSWTDDTSSAAQTRLPLQANGEDSGTSGSPNGPLIFNVTDTEAEDVSLTAYDTGSQGDTVASASATQTFSPRIGGLEVTSNTSTIAADNSDTAQITAQLTDGEGNEVPRSGASVSYSISNQSAAGVDNINPASQTAETNSSGVATLTFTAKNSGAMVDITAIETNTGNQYSGTATVETVSGDISTGNSQLKINGNPQPNNDVTDVQVATEHNLTVVLQDGESNPVTDVDVELTANQSGASLGSQTITTNETGEATTTVTLPEEKGTTQINASAMNFNASATDRATVSVTTKAANTTALAFADDSATSVAPNSEDNTITIEAVDQYGNVNASTSGTVTLESSDASIGNFDGSASNDVTLSSGTASFNADANGTGTATLSATIPDANITNASQDIMVADPGGLEMTFDHNVATSDVSNSNTATTTNLTAQFVDDSGDALGITDENITFARQSGDAAELDQSLDDYTETTDGDGNVTIQVNGTSNTGETTFIAIAENYSVQGSGTVTTTGAADRIHVTAEESSIEQNASTNVTATFVDSNDRVVPRTQSIQVSTDFGSFDDTQKKTTLDAGATYTFNAPADEGGEASITALGGGLTGSTTVTVAEDAAANISVDYTVDSTNVSVNETVTTTATVENTGNAAGSTDLTFYADGEEVDNASVDDLGAGNSTTVEFTTSFDSAGSHNVTVNDLDATEITVTEDDGERTAEDYQIDGEYTSQSVFTAIDDWRNDDIEPTVVFGVIDGWRNDG